MRARFKTRQRIRGHAHERARGLTLLEVSIVVGLTAVIGLTLGNVVIGTTRSVDYLMKDTINVEQVQDTVNTIRDEIKDTVASQVTIQPGTFSDTLYLRLGRYDDTYNTMVYGAETQTGVWLSGCQVRYEVAGTDLVRSLLPTAGVVTYSEIVARNLDIGTTGVKGFTVIKNGNLFTIRMATNKTFDDGKNYKKTMQSTVRVQN